MIVVIITACSILYSGGPISSISPELKDGTCRQFHQRVQPKFTAFGDVNNPIIIDMTPKFIDPAQCEKYGQMAIKDWKETYPGANNVSINKWSCSTSDERDDI